MSKIYKFFEYLNLNQASQYLSYLIKEPVAESLLIDLINNQHLISYQQDYVFLTPITLNSKKTEIEILKLNDQRNMALYLYIPRMMSGIHYFQQDLESTTFYNAYLIKHKNTYYTLTTFNQDEMLATDETNLTNLKTIYPIQSNLTQTDNNQHICLKTHDIEQLAKHINSKSKEITLPTYKNIELTYTSLNKKPIKLSFINSQPTSATNTELDNQAVKSVKTKALHTKERDTLYTIIAILTVYAKLDITKDHSVAAKLNRIAFKAGIENRHRDTIAHHLTKALDYLPENIKLSSTK